MVRQNLDMNYVLAAIFNEVSYTEIARRESERLGVTVTKNTISALKRDIRSGRYFINKPDDKPFDTFVYGQENDNGGMPLFTGELHVNSERMMIQNDHHFPFSDHWLLERAVATAKYLGIEDLWWLGDALDMKSITTFSSLYSSNVNLHREEQAAMDYLTYFVDNVPTLKRIFYTPGNHEHRLMRGSDGQIDFVRYVKSWMFENPKLREMVTISPYDRAFVNMSGEEWLFSHPDGASDVYKTRVGEKLVDKYRKNVVVPHFHKNAMQRDRYGHNKIVVVGGLHDPDTHAWINMRTNTHPIHEKGFATIVDRDVNLWTEDEFFTKWSTVGQSSK